MNMKRSKGWEGERKPNLMLSNLVFSKHVNVKNPQLQKEIYFLHFIEKFTETL